MNSSVGADIQTACDSYTWIDGITYTSSNITATDTLTNIAGCDSVVTLNLTINTVDKGIVNNSSTLIANASGAVYQWLDCDNNYTPISGAISQNYTPVHSGNYAVEVTQNNCTDTSDCESITVVGVLENSFPAAPYIYPNPTSGKLSIQFKNVYKSITINVRTIGGRLVSSETHETTSYIPIEINEVTGIYIVEVFDNKGNSAKLRVVII
jgi:hypothetical protein